jgi:hypothetical protein
MPEQRSEHAQTTIEFLDRVNSAEVMAAPESRKEFILGLDYDNFRGWLIRTNAMTRGIDPKQHVIDGTSVEVMSLMPPEQEDKEPLLQATLKGAQEILAKGENTQKALDDASLLFSGAINYIHAFSDGNGRTSRVIGYLTKEGYDGSVEAQDKVKKIMADKGSIVFQNNPGLLTKWLNQRVTHGHAPKGASKWPLYANPDLFVGEPFEDEAMAHLSPESRAKAEKVLRDGDFGSLAVTKIMIERGLLPDGTDFGEKNFVWVDQKDYFAKFSDQDIDAVFNESKLMRRERVEAFIEAMVKPESFSIHMTQETDQVRFQDRESTLRDYYAEVFIDNSKLYTERNALQRRHDQRTGSTALQAEQK